MMAHTIIVHISKFVIQLNCFLLVDSDNDL